MTDVDGERNEWRVLQVVRLVSAPVGDCMNE